jgi:triacylglycerol lipase
MTIPTLRTPIVLVHGLLGFNKIKAAGVTLLDYFRGVPPILTAAGNRILIPSLSPTGGVADRAKELKDFIVKHSPAEPVHLIAHSMGGLDARYMISCLDMSPKVLTLTTLGTPHKGTSFADWGVERFERIAKPILDTLGMPYQAFYDLTRPSCKTFNEKVLDVPTVRYFSISGKHDGHIFHPEWLLPFSIVARHEGDNDGIVSVASASYGETVDIWAGDHVMLVNWFNPIHHFRGLWTDPAVRYGAILRRLADLGY